MPEITTTIKTFKYENPAADRSKKILWLGKTDRLFATIQVLKEGGETSLHSHTHLDGFWFVLAGRGRFYSDETTLVADLGPNEGILIPRGIKYWFESGDPNEPLQLLQVECSDVPFRTQEALFSDRNDFTKPTWSSDVEQIDL